jgi:pimeloyl-[acyl-carrier protein] methyl ester esterase
MPVMKLSDGRRLAWRQTGSGPPLVLLHGWGMTSAAFAGLSELLAPTFELFAPDLRGHGDSEAGSGYTLPELAADVAEWCETLEVQDAALLGWSLGGQVALTLCPLLQGRLRRLLLVATTPRFVAADDWPHGLPDGRVRVMVRNLKKAPRLTVEDFWYSQFAAGETPLPPTGMLTDAEQGLVPLLATLDTLRHSDLRGALAAVALPTLVVQGGGDGVTLPTAADWLAGHLPHGELVVWEEAGHAPFLTQPEKFSGLVREFLP